MRVKSVGGLQATAAASPLGSPVTPRSPSRLGWSAVTASIAARYPPAECPQAATRPMSTPSSVPCRRIHRTAAFTSCSCAGRRPPAQPVLRPSDRETVVHQRFGDVVADPPVLVRAGRERAAVQEHHHRGRGAGRHDEVQQQRPIAGQRRHERVAVDHPGPGALGSGQGERGQGARGVSTGPLSGPSRARGQQYHDAGGMPRFAGVAPGRGEAGFGPGAGSSPATPTGRHGACNDQQRSRGAAVAVLVGSTNPVGELPERSARYPACPGG